MKSKIKAVFSVLLPLTALSSCYYKSKLPPLPDSQTTSISAEFTETTDSLSVGLYIFTYYTHKVFDSYTNTMKDVQITDFYPIDLSSDSDNITLNVNVQAQSFPNDDSKMTYMCFADGQLCDLEFNGKSCQSLTKKYKLNDALNFEHSIITKNENPPLMSVIICADNDLPKDEKEWYEWSTKAHYVNAERLSTKDVEVGANEQRKNIPYSELDSKLILSDKPFTDNVMLKISDALSDNIDFSGGYSISGTEIYLYCGAPEGNYSLLLLVDDSPVPVFNEKFGADYTCTEGKGFIRIPVKLENEILRGQHSIQLLLIDRDNYCIYSSTPQILDNGDRQ